MGYKDHDPCLDRAEPDEPIFVGLGRDPLAAVMTLVWAVLSEDCQPEGQVVEAQDHAARMMAYCRERNPGRRDERLTAAAVDRAITLLQVVREDVAALGEDERRELTEARRRRAEHEADVAAGGPGHLVPWAEAKRLIDEEAEP